MQYLNEKSLSLFPNITESMEEKKKQERKVVHLQIGDKHLYYGSISRLFDDFDYQRKENVILCRIKAR